MYSYDKDQLFKIRDSIMGPCMHTFVEWTYNTCCTGVFYLSTPEGAARPFHQLALPCVILLTDGPSKHSTSGKFVATYSISDGRLNHCQCKQYICWSVPGATGQTLNYANERVTSHSNRNQSVLNTTLDPNHFLVVCVVV